MELEVLPIRTRQVELVTLNIIFSVVCLWRLPLLVRNSINRGLMINISWTYINIYNRSSRNNGEHSIFFRVLTTILHFFQMETQMLSIYIVQVQEHEYNCRDDDLAKTPIPGHCNHWHGPTKGPPSANRCCPLLANDNWEQAWGDPPPPSHVELYVFISDFVPFYSFGLTKA